MTNNNVLRSIRFTFDFTEAKIIEIFALADCAVTQDQVTAWLKKDADPDFQLCTDTQLSNFLNGLINDRRGKGDGPVRVPDENLTNNIIFNKLKIALDLKADEVMDILIMTDIDISRHELSALFRKPGHKHYRECTDAMLMNFLNGLQLKYHSESEDGSDLGNL